MEIRDPIHGSIELTPAETAIIDHPFFQRLRNIKQLGFTEFSFPGATHNRYCHSLGAMHLAGTAFDHIFQGYGFSSPQVKWRLRQIVRLASLLHDVGHGPLSHTTEEVMPVVDELKIPIYKKNLKRKATHEDYTIKIITDSDLSLVLEKEFSDFKPLHIACLIDKDLVSKDDFFVDGKTDLRPLLSQIVSSELDVDRMDYLARDSYYCGTSYGHVDSDWLLGNFTHYQKNGKLYLALNHRALYTFDDFLISRFHMYLMVYFHRKGVIYDEMLLRYLKSKDCDFFLPADINKYLEYDDNKLHTQMRQSPNRWAQLISQRKPFRMLFESHENKTTDVKTLETKLEKAGIETIKVSTSGRLSKYYSNQGQGSPEPIFVIDTDRGPKQIAKPIEETTQIFNKYEEARNIERLYVNRDKYLQAQKILG